MVAELLRFEGFELDLSANRLRRAGREVHVERIPFELLCLLIERRGQLVTREEIRERIWGKGFSIDSENAINTAVRKIRRALNDDAQEPRLIITVPSRGYRFDAVTHSARADSVQPPLSWGTFIGREREMTELRAGLAAALSGHGGLFFISGQPGIGKTRLARELGALAQTQGIEVLVGQCSGHDEAIPYLPFVEILESYVERTFGADHLRAMLGEEGPELVRLLPRLKRTLPDLPPALDLPPQEARRHLFNCICDFIGRMSRDHATLLIFEDLQWADDSSSSLLGHLARRLSGLPLMVVATYRDVELDISPGLTRTLEEFRRGRLATEIKLAGLEREEIGPMLRSLGGQEPAVAVVNRVYDETAGNPFSVEGLFPHLDEKHQLNDADGVFRPELKIAESEVRASVRLAVGQRLTRLSEWAQKMPGTPVTIGGALSIIGLAILAATFAIIRHISVRLPATPVSIPLEDKTPALPETPSIAVLPFRNLSGDRDQEYFSDGVTEDLTIALSRMPDVLVIFAASAFSYKDKSWRPQDIGSELGVQYLVEGGVRNADNQMRLTAHLVEAATGREVWAANYDRPLTDRFTTQDEIVQRIADTLNIRVQLEQTGAGSPEISAMLPHGWGASSSEAYEDFLRGVVYLASGTKEGNAKAREMEQEAIALDPNYAVAYLVLGNTYFSDIVQQWSRDGDLERASEAVHKGLAVADSNLCLSCAYISASREAMFKSQNEQAISYAERAVNLDPNLSYAYLALGEALITAGKAEEGLAALQKGMRRDPRNRDVYLGDVATAYLVEGRYADAVPILKHCAARFPSSIAIHSELVVAYTEQGQNQEARAEAAKILRINPRYSVERQVRFFKDGSVDARWRSDEREAGLT